MKTRKLSKRRLLSAIFTGLVVGITVVAVVLFNQSRGPVVQRTQQTTVQNQTTSHSYVAEKDKTVLEQLQKIAQVEVKESAYGPFVETINGVKSGTDNKYWVYYVNGQMATQGAGDYATEGGETIEWKFE